MGGERSVSELKHTHYDPYGPPRQVPGTLLDCTPEYPSFHKVDGSELWADYAYSPRLGPVSNTGLPPETERAIVTAYLEHKAADMRWVIEDVTPDKEYTYRVRITNRTSHHGDGPDWHTVTYGLHRDGVWRAIAKNPHPGYLHWEAFCPNCGY